MSAKITLTHDNIETAAALVAVRMKNRGWCNGNYNLAPIPRGGVPVAYAMAKYLPQNPRIVETPDASSIVIDDLIDSGVTRDKYGSTRFAALYSKGRFANDSNTVIGSLVAAESWLVFPWEGSEVASATDIPTRLLQFIGEDPAREGLLETPERFIKAWQHYTSGYNMAPVDVLKHFEDGAEGYDEMVVQTNIPVYSHCEHHLAPFFGVAHVAYVPNKRIVGLSKVSRVVDILSRRLQVQERLTTQIADSFMDCLDPKGVAVALKCRHCCMEMRGIQRSGILTTTQALRGVFFDKPAARSEFMELCRG